MLARTLALAALALLLVGCGSNPPEAQREPTPSPEKTAPTTPATPTDTTGTAALGPAPDFTLRDRDGESVSLATLRADRPVALYFIQEDCPVNTRAVGFYNDLAAAHRGSVEFVGIIDAEGEKRDAWVSRHAPDYRLLSDPDLMVTKEYGVQRSPWLVLVDRDGKRLGEWNGFSLGMLQEMNEALAKAAGKSAPEIGFTGAPERAQYG